MQLSLAVSCSADKCAYLNYNILVLHTYQVTLSQRQGTSYTDSTNGEAWDVFDLDIKAAYMVTIVALSVYTQINNGFVEVEFYGTEGTRTPCISFI